MDFKKAQFLLEHHYPLVFPHRVIRKKMDDDIYGSCVVKTRNGPTRIEICVHKDLDPVAQLDTLIHEWAHARLAAIPEEFHAHSAAWGVYYAQCYLAVYPD